MRKTLAKILTCTVVLCAASSMTRCAALHHSSNAAREIVLEIHNAQTIPVTIAYGTGSSATNLGSVAVGDTRRWAIPNATGKRIHLAASDASGKLIMSKDLDLNGQVIRWEIRQ